MPTEPIEQQLELSQACSALSACCCAAACQHALGELRASARCAIARKPSADQRVHGAAAPGQAATSRAGPAWRV
jgi:hypothetical protein